MMSRIGCINRFFTGVQGLNRAVPAYILLKGKKNIKKKEHYFESLLLSKYRTEGRTGSASFTALENLL